MIKLHQYKAGYGLPNLSPFCMKVETFLRIADLPFQTILVDDPRKTPKGKAPYIEDDGHVVADSHLIVEYLSETHGLTLDAHLTAPERAVGHAFERMLEERTYWVMIYSRWLEPEVWPAMREFWFAGMPPIIRNIVPVLALRQVKSNLQGHGIGRHSRDEIYSMGIKDLDCLATHLADNAFFHGDEPSAVDATVYAFVANLIVAPFDSPLKQAAHKHGNLAPYCQRMSERFYAGS